MLFFKISHVFFSEISKKSGKSVNFLLSVAYIIALYNKYCQVML